MDYIANMGPTGWLLILLIPLTLLVALVLRFAVPRLRMYGAPLFTGVFLLGLGTTGTFAGFIQMFKAVAYASPDTKAALMASGTSIAVSPTFVAIGGTVLIGAFWALVRVLPIRNPRPPARDKAGWAMTILSVALLLLWLITVPLGGYLINQFMHLAGAVEYSLSAEETVQLAARLSMMMNVGLGISLLSLLAGLLMIPVTGIVAILRLRKAGAAEED